VEELLEGSDSGRLPLKPLAVEHVIADASHTAAQRRARTADELAVLLLELGDLTEAEIAERSASDPRPWLTELAERRTIVRLGAATTRGGEPRWVPAELADEYAALYPERSHEVARSPALHPEQNHEVAQSKDAHGLHLESILSRWLRWSGPVTRSEILIRYPFAPDLLDTTLDRLLAGHAIVQGHFSTEGGEPEYCDRQLFEQFYRRTLNLLRHEAQPVPLAAYQTFLLSWQGVWPAQSTEERSLDRVMRQLRGLALPALAWEREVLPGRVPRDGWRDLDRLVQAGEYAWVAAGSEGGRADVRFIARREGSLFLLDLPNALPPGPAGDVAAYLRAEGPSFFADIQGGTRLGAGALRDALRQLALAGILTGEDLWALAAVLRARGGPAEPRQMSALEEDLAARLSQKGGSGSPRLAGRGRGGATTSQQRYRDLRRSIGQRLDAEAEWDQAWMGRWSLVNRAAVMGPALRGDERGLGLARLVLDRYGIVTPEIIARFESRWAWTGEETGARPVRELWEGRKMPDEPTELHAPQEVPWNWGELFEQLQRMELRGEVRRGYFVRGLSGVQFALPLALEALRGAPVGLAGNDEVVILSALDPANLYGGDLGAMSAESAARLDSEDAGAEQSELVPVADLSSAALRFARVPSTHVALWRGWPVLVGEDSGARLSAAEVSDDVLHEALRRYLNRPAAPRRVAIEMWNGGPIIGSRGETLLRELGASRSPTGLDWWRTG